MTTLAFLAWIGVAAAAWWTRRRAAHRTTELAAARLAMLGGELRARFLLNALNAAAELVHHEPETADRVLTALGGLPRQVLRHARRPESPLAEERELLRRYVAVECTRFGDAVGLAVHARHGASPERGVGLRNVRSRLQVLYGAASDAQITSRPEHGTTVVVCLPWRRAV